jgi:hypothetical protein
MHGGKHLFIFANTGEYYVPISNTEPVTPTNVSLVRNASNGIEKGLQAFEIDGNLIYVRSGGKSLIEAKYEFTSGGYDSTDLSLLSSHLLNSPQSIAYRKQTDASEADYVLVVNGDGTLAILCILTKQSIAAWSHCSTEGKFRETSVDGSMMYFVVERTINGTLINYLERFNKDLLVDCGAINPSSPSGSGTLTAFDVEYDYIDGKFTGINHMAIANENANIILDNTIQPDQIVDANGDVTFARVGATCQAGIPFPIVNEEYGYSVWIESMPIEFNNPSFDVSIRGRKKRVSTVTIQLYETSHIEVRNNRATIRKLGVDHLDLPLPKISEDITISGILGWSNLITISCGQTLPLPMTLLGMIYKVTI